MSESPMKFHEYADIFPLLVGPPLRTLVADIRAHGLRYPITTYEDQILDGRNRFRACKLAGVEPRFKEFKGTDESALAFAISSNIERRHLNESQLGLISVELEKKFERLIKERETERKKQGPKTVASVPQSKARDQAAAAVGVSPRLVQQAKKVVAEAPKEVIAAIRGGAVTVGQAYRELETNKAVQRMKEVEKKKVQRRVEQEDKAVKKYLDALKDLRAWGEKWKDFAVETAKQKKFSPEAQRFVVGWHDSIRKVFTAVEDQFDER